jgi:ribosomal protein L29
MKFKELKTKSDKELAKLLTDAKDKLRDLNFKVASKQLKNVREVRDVKTLVARVLTLQKTKSIEPNKSEVKKEAE